jgi:predicted AAA+ superfamily ATPase
MRPLPRTMSETLAHLSRTVPVIALFGPRGSGKTTLAKTCGGPNRSYLTLEDQGLRRQAREDPDAFLNNHKAPVTIDDIHLAPQLVDCLLDRLSDATAFGSYWLITSHGEALEGLKVGSAMRSWTTHLRLLGLSQAELSHRASIQVPFRPTPSWLEQAGRMAPLASPLGIYPAIWQGTLPRPVCDEAVSRETFYECYIEDFITRDIRPKRVLNTVAFRRFLSVVARHTAKPVNYAAMARDVGMNIHTAQAWLALLESFGWVYMLQPRRDVAPKISVRTPKLYFLDTGLCSYLCDVSTPDALETADVNAAMVETYMLVEILKSYWNRGMSPDFAFYRDGAQKEVDLIIPVEGTLFPVEFRKTMTPHLNATKNFSVLDTRDTLLPPRGTGAVVALHTKDFLLSKAVHAIPVHYI